MRRKRRVARAAASAAFAVALAMGAMSPGVAFADDQSTAVGAGTGKITVNATSGNTGMVYDVYKIFTCDVGPASDNTSTYVATNISFSSDEMWHTVVSAIDTYDGTFFSGTVNDNNYKDKTAQECADYLESTVKESGTSYRAEANGLIMNLAKAIDDTGAIDTITASTDSVDNTKTLTEGYYMIVPRPSTQSDSALSSSSSRMGTSPIFAMIPESDTVTITIAEKTSLPTLEKKVAEGSATTGTAVYTDAQIGQDVSFTLTGTIPDNIVTFTSYAYTFEDTLPTGMELSTASGSFAESDVTVNVVNGNDSKQIAATSYAAAYESSNNTLTVSFTADGGSNDIKVAKDTSGADVTIDADSQVTVSYSAKLTTGATSGSGGNANSAKLVYSNDPQNPTSTGTSTAATATVYTYKLKLCKYGADTKKKLSGAKFTIQATTTDDTDSEGKFVKIDGTLGAKTLPDSGATDYSSYVFETNSEGLIEVPGLDAGTYTISEVAAPESYKMLTAPLTLVISPSFNDGAFDKMSATLSGGNGDANTKVASTTDGIITINVTNALTEGKLPLTGLPGITLVYVAGGLILVISLAIIIRRRVKNRK